MHDTLQSLAQFSLPATILTVLRFLLYVFIEWKTTNNPRVAMPPPHCARRDPLPQCLARTRLLMMIYTMMQNR